MVQTETFPQLILLLVTDQFRHDGFGPTMTPNLFKLSRHPNATVFTNAYTSTPTCTPARAGLLTGKSPWAHGMLGYASSVNCQEYPTTLPSILADLCGYETVAIGKNHFGWNITTKQYVTHGFHHLKVYDALANEPQFDDYRTYFDNLHPGVDPLDVTCNHLGYNDWRACAYGSNKEEEHPTAWTTREALKYLESFDFSNPDNKLFLKVSYHRPHSPYDPPRRLFDKHLRPSSKIPRRIMNNTSWDRQYVNNTAMQANDWHGDPGEQAALHTRAGYLASIEFVDEGIGKIMDWLQCYDNNNKNSTISNNHRSDGNLVDSSMIFWATDHGDMNGDHNLWRKGYPYEGSSHVNLVVKIPTQHGSANDSTESTIPHVQKTSPEPDDDDHQPKTSTALVELRDIAVTIYDYLGVLREVKRRDQLVNGRSLMNILDCAKRDGQVRQWLDMEHGVVYHESIHWNALVGFHGNASDIDTISSDDKTEAEAHSSSSVGTLLWKYVFFAMDGSEQLFCLSNDSKEMVDLSKDERWSNNLLFWRNVMISQFKNEERGEKWVKGGKLQRRPRSVTFGPNYPCNITAVPCGDDYMFKDTSTMKNEKL